MAAKLWQTGATGRNPVRPGAPHKKFSDRLAGFVDRNLHIIFPAPAVIVVAILMVFPLGYTIWMSLHKWFVSSVMPPTWVGLKNFVDIFASDERFLSSLWTTIYFTALALVLQVVVGFIFALILNRDFLGKGVARTIFLLPMVATPAAIALVWMMMFNPTLGIMNYLLHLFHIPPSLWVSDPATVIPSLVLVDTWEWTPLVTLIILAGLQALPTEPFEAATIDGASWFASLRYITIPLVRPAIVVAMIFRVIDALKTYDIIYVMTQGGPGLTSENLNVYTFQTSFNYFQMGYGSALALVLFGLVSLVTLALVKVRRAA